MIEMFVTGIAIDMRNNHPLVILNDTSKERALPIWIGQPEAQAIARALEEFEAERPLTHDLMLNIIKETGRKIHHIEITDISDNTYFSSIVLEDVNGEQYTIDSRPSDAIALSIRVDCAIYVTQKVFDEGTVQTEFEGFEGEENEDDTKAFKNFIQNVKASDFKLTNEGEDNKS